MIDIREISQKEFYQTFPHPGHVYNSSEFTSLNAHRCRSLHFLWFGDRKARLGLILGEKDDGSLSSPFSSPFGGFSANRDVSLDSITGSIAALTRWCAGRACHITLPPEFYESDLIAKSVFALSSDDRWTGGIVPNYHYPLRDFPDYMESLLNNRRGRLRHALADTFTFERTDDIARAYAVIAGNRARKGYPLRMTLDTVLHTAPIVNAEAFILSDGDTDVAAALTYRSAPRIRQVIYWGDIAGYEHRNPMTLLAYRLLEHYASSQKYGIIDAGPAGDFHDVNLTLADFKESIGFSIGLKHRFTLSGTAE